MAETNHTHGPKTHAIQCEGYKDENGKKQFADDHTEIRLVHKQDAHQVKRCEACQKAHQKVRSKIYRRNAAEARKVKRVEDTAAEAKDTMERLKDKLTPAQKKILKAAIDAAK